MRPGIGLKVSSLDPATLGPLRLAMLSLPPVALVLAAICVYAKPTVRAVGGLEISLSTPTDKFASASDLRVFATVKNVGDEDLKILKSGTVLDDELPTRSIIISKDGKEVPFTRVTVRPYLPPSPAPALPTSWAVD